MNQSKMLKVLLIEDSELDATLIISTLENDGYTLKSKRVDTEEGMKKALQEENWDVVISDFTMPKFRCLDALKTLKEHNPDIPFILVSGAIGEETAVMVMKKGASDYIMKNNLNRLPEAIKREQEESHTRVELREAEERYHKLVELSPDGILIQGAKNIEFINHAGCEFLGAEKDTDIIGKPFLSFLDDSCRSLFKEYIDNLKDNPLSNLIAKEGKFIRLDNTVRDSEFVLAPFIFKNNTEIQIIFRDITEKKKTESMVHFDPLTGLSSRFLFETLLSKLLVHAERYGYQFAVIFFDLDNFKYVNDTYGHDTGDYVLKTLGERLLNFLRKSDIVSRFGGDEFVIVLPKIESREALKAFISSFIERIREPINLQGKDFLTELSAGVSLFPDNGKDIATLINKADTAMYQAKKRGKNSFQFFSE